MKFKGIITLLNSNLPVNTIQSVLTSATFNDEDFVKIASANLVVPKVYSHLKEKGLLHVLPEELKDYLAEIYRLNTERNQQLLKEIQFISQLFIANNINHVFTKGAALLVSGYLNDIGARMIGDIDVLICPTQIDKAKAILQKEDYYHFYSDIPYTHLNEHQMGRLISKTKLAAIELHRRLLFYGESDFFNAKDYLDNKQFINGIYIGNPKYLLLHTIHNLQCNDFAYYHNSIHLKTIADYLVLKDKYELTKADLSNKYIKNFMAKYHFLIAPKQKVTGYKMHVFKIKSKYPILRKLSYVILEAIRKLWFASRVAFKFISSSAMRKTYFEYKRNLKTNTSYN